MATSSNDNWDVMEKLWGTQQLDEAKDAMKQMQAELAHQKYAAHAAQQNQQALTNSQMYSQLQNAYGSAAGPQIPSVWSTSSTSGTTLGQVYQNPQPVESMDEARFKQLVMLQVINLIANFGPTVSKKICVRFNLQITRDEIDQIHKDLTRAIADDDDQDLEKVINDVAKEVKL